MVIFLENNLVEVMLSLCGAVLVLLLAVIYLLIRVGGNRRKIRKMSLVNDAWRQEEIIQKHAESIKGVEEGLEEIKKEINHLEILVENSIMGVGFQRYNAIKDAGGDLSFSLALMNGKKEGVVVSSIFGRDETRVYAKDVVEGKSKYRLSEEEVQAISQAQEAIDKIQGGVRIEK